MTRLVISLMFSLAWLGWGQLSQGAAPPQPLPRTTPTSQWTGSTQGCPGDLQPLTMALLRDLPGYANRVASRSLGALAREAGPAGTVLIAGNPEFEPLDLAPQSLSPGLEPDPDIRQVFFTTLEHQYQKGRVVALQQYHWLFLVQTSEGWQLALLYSSLGTYSGNPLPSSPARESSDGVIGQAIKLWLRDCRAGAVSGASPSTRE
ncbi:MAG: hypothetical protein KGQ93_03105 [Cyanobacteria bacterium REEB459]|nr:hypothetical protein [Cyanobacteria bacterium REEB459]